MRTLAILMAAGSLSAAAFVSTPGAANTLGDTLDDARTEVALKCQQTWPPSGAAIVLNGTLAWSGESMRDMTREEIDEMVGDWDQVVSLDIICRPEFERLGVAAYEGIYILTRDSGVQSLDEALQEIHALQEAHRGEHGRWGESLDALGFTAADSRLSIEMAVEVEDQTWIARGTHAVGIRRCAVSGSNLSGGKDSAEGSVEEPVAPTCRRMTAGDEAFPSLVTAEDSA